MTTIKYMNTLPKTSGIYQIRNTTNNKLYIGSTTSFYRRWQEHQRKLNLNKYTSSKLQNAWNKYGKEAFIFEILLQCDKDSLLSQEQYYIDKFDAVNLGYNTAPKAGNTLGIKKPPMSEEQKQKISITMTGKKISWPEEARQRQIESNKNRVWTEEAKFKAGATNRGKKLSEEQKKKMSDSHKAIPGKPHTEETKAKLSVIAKNRNRTISPELQAKMKEARAKTKRPMPPGHQEKLIAARKAAALKRKESK